jgi:allantoinase
VTEYHRGRVFSPRGMDHELYRFSAMPARAPLSWPGGARVAVVVSVAVETAALRLPAGEWQLPGSPTWLDVSAWSLYDYGPRVGLFRLGAILDQLPVRVSMPVSDAVLQAAPRVAEYALERGWELVGHGDVANRLVTSRVSEAAELEYLNASRAAIVAVSGVPPRGWMGPERSESARTPVLAAQVGYDYVMDWGNDDQPYDMTVPDGRLTSVPVSVDTSDEPVLGPYAQTPWDHAAALKDHLAALCDEEPGSCMTVSLRAHLSGQPFRARHVRDFLQHASARPEVWFATGSQVVEAYRAARPNRSGADEQRREAGPE